MHTVRQENTMYEYKLVFVAGTEYTGESTLVSKTPIGVGDKIMLAEERSVYKVVDVVHYFAKGCETHSLTCEYN
jgi:hypothetical protein